MISIPIKNLILFDIDGTLLTSLGDDRFVKTINNIHSLAIKSDKDFRGYTDYLILAALLESEGWNDRQIEVAMPKLLKELDRVHQETFHADDMKLLPGVETLLKGLDRKQAILGLITGNLKSIAQRKLESLGIWSYFSVGGFGNDPHVTRSDLVRTAIKRAGYENHPENVYVIGDTPRDILAAKEAGISNSVGVTNGYRKAQELIDAGAKVVLEDFRNTKEVLSKLALD